MNCWQIPEYDALAVRSADNRDSRSAGCCSPKLKVSWPRWCRCRQHRRSRHQTRRCGNERPAWQHLVGCRTYLGHVVRCGPQHSASPPQTAKRHLGQEIHIGVELQGKTLAIIGLGKIGKHVAKVAQAAGMSVVAFDPFLSREVAEDLGIESLELEDCFKQADFITVHTPLTDKTKNMIGTETIGLMKPGVRIINVARGGIIDEEALAVALKKAAWLPLPSTSSPPEPLTADSP